MMGYNMVQELMLQDIRGSAENAARAQAARNNAAGFVQNGSICLDKKDWNGAIDNFTKAVNADPSFSISYKGLCIAYFRKGEYDKAMSAADQALSYNAIDAEVYDMRGTIYYNKKDYDRALSDYTYSIRISPTSAVAYCNRGNAYCQRGDYAKGRADLEKALQINPNLKEAQNALALLRQKGL
jgi:tetratricopeptide (TPR) repeat protein